MSDIATLHGTRTGVSEAALEELRARVRGAVLEPSDPGQQDVREVFNAMHPSSPAVTVRCTGTADVVAAVDFAREQGMALAVRGGGHSIAGLSAIEGGVLLDLALMRGVQVDPDRRLAVVQGGALWGDVDRETQAFGLVAPGGVVSDTGVAGLTLGGGYGWVRRKYGLSVDALVEAQIVCADGEVRTASADANPDLFWAIRGGGGNFGVVTSFTFALQPLGPVVGFSATFYPARGDRRRPARLARLRRRQAPDEVTSVVVTITFPADPRPSRSGPRPARRDRRRRIRRRPHRGPPGDGPAARARHAAVRHVGADAVHGGAVRLRRAVPAQHAARVLEVAVPRRAPRRRDRRDRRPGAQPARPAHAGQHVPHGRRHRRHGPGGDRLRRALGAVHGLDRRHVVRSGR